MRQTDMSQKLPFPAPMAISRKGVGGGSARVGVKAAGLEAAGLDAAGLEAVGVQAAGMVLMGRARRVD